LGEIWADAWIADREPRRYLYTRTRLRLCLAKARKEITWLENFSKSVVNRTKVSFSKSEILALEAQFACLFGLTDVTFHLSSLLGSLLQSFLS